MLYSQFLKLLCFIQTRCVLVFLSYLAMSVSRSFSGLKLNRQPKVTDDSSQIVLQHHVFTLEVPVS